MKEIGTNVKCEREYEDKTQLVVLGWNMERPYSGFCFVQRRRSVRTQEACNARVQVWRQLHGNACTLLSVYH